MGLLFMFSSWYILVVSLIFTVAAVVAVRITSVSAIKCDFLMLIWIMEEFATYLNYN